MAPDHKTGTHAYADACTPAPTPPPACQPTRNLRAHLHPRVTRAETGAYARACVCSCAPPNQKLTSVPAALWVDWPEICAPACAHASPDQKLARTPAPARQLTKNSHLRQRPYQLNKTCAPAHAGTSADQKLAGPCIAHTCARFAHLIFCHRPTAITLNPILHPQRYKWGVGQKVQVDEGNQARWSRDGGHCCQKGVRHRQDVFPIPLH